MNHENDNRIKALAKLVTGAPEAQYMLVFKGRSMPATFASCDELCDASGEKYTSLTFWDGDSGNLFDVDYRLLPEEVFVNGVKTEF